MHICRFCYTSFTLFFLHISTFLRPKRLIVRAMIFGNATGALIFCFVPVCIAESGTLKIAVIGPMPGKDQEGGQAMLDGVI